MNPLAASTRSAAILSALLALTACGGDKGAQQDEALASRVMRGADRYPREGLIAVKADLNNDRIPDVYSVYREETPEGGGEPARQLIRKEIDVNFDGTLDIWRHYNDEELVIKEELDYNFDGRVDAINYYDQGQLVRKEIDVEFDQAPDVFKHYKNNQLVSVERDTNNDGRLDYWEYYERGVLDRIGRDNDGDGSVDTWQER
jgi:hypothetical protein